jgi:DNA-binding CsgD family transcriptional regulator
VARSVAAAVVIFSPVDRRLNLFTHAPLIVNHETGLEALERARREYLADFRALDPFAPSRWSQSTRTVVGVREVGGPHAFARSSYHEFLASHGMASQTSIFLRDCGRIVAAILLLRRREEPDPTSAELQLLRGTQPLLEQALALARGLPLPAHGDLLSVAGLTPREIEVARVAAAGATNAEIALALFVSLATVKTHMSRVLTKTGARSRTELVALLRAGAQPIAPSQSAARPGTAPPPACSPAQIDSRNVAGAA